MAEEKERPNGLTILAFLCMTGTYLATVILLFLAPFLSDTPVAWLGWPAGLALLWVGRGVAKGRWSR